MPFHRSIARRQAFTLIELVAVMGIIILLAGIAVGGIGAVKQRANIARARSELAIIAQALEEYKRFYGDYPQTGPALAGSYRVSLNTQGVSVGPGTTTVQSRLLSALLGVYGPNNFTTRLNGPNFIDVGKLHLEVPFSTPTQTTNNPMATFAVASGTPPAKQPVNNSLVDPWGNRYMYFYKSVPAPGRPAPAWQAPAYVLFSVGPDGASTTLPGATGLYAGTAQTSNDNADNIYADKPQ